MPKPSKKPVKKASEKKEPAYWYFSVSYDSDRFEWPHKDSLDERIVKAMGASHESGSGMGMGGRDIGFTYNTKKSLEAAKKRFFKLNRKVRGLKKEITYYPRGWNL